ncbi:uncharacterized protein PV07_11639 [Cladophialophora immunda]|uniref:DUF336-domain-containing protein n=1 Tax=Cladophialophora immunda TaxID=569365 RepID=A0A0D2BYN1_9EURO|nr:uncharacterized protein PV07_11639 [Cladophialophora immunda]KIW23445.1 hypothetical protein PV07_11639 [Cladophialophora immunda]
MKVSSILTFLTSIVPAAMSQQVNRSATNGWGSTPSQRHYINHTQALQVINAGIQRAEAIGDHVSLTKIMGNKSVPQNIAVLDPSSWLVAFVHMDNSFLGSIDISQKKAKTVVLYNGIPNNALQNRSEPGGDLWGIQETNGGTVVFGGGQPIFDPDGYFIGAVGVSGGTVEQDIDVAVHAAQSIGTTVTSSS